MRARQRDGKNLNTMDEVKGQLPFVRLQDRKNHVYRGKPVPVIDTDKAVQTGRELEELQAMMRMLREQKRRLYRSSLYHFAKYCLDNPDLEKEAHLPLCQALQNYYWGVGQKPEHRKGVRKLLVMMPRNTLKSTICTVAFPLWIMMQNDPSALERFSPDGKPAWTPPTSFNGKPGYNQRILISNAVEGLATDFVTSIQTKLLRSEELIETFGSAAWEKKTAGTWGSGYFDLAWRSDIQAKEPNCNSGSMNKQVNSGHYDICINDDMINEQWVTNEDMIERTKDFHKNQQPVLEKPGLQIYIGTHWHDADLYDYLRTDPGEKQQFDYIIERAIRTEEEVAAGKRLLFCETKHSLEWLAQERITLGDYKFSCQYLNDPIDQAAARFKKEYFDGQTYTLPADPDQRRAWVSKLNIYTAGDPAISKEKAGCHAVILTCGWDHTGNCYLLDLFAKKGVSPSDYLDEFFRQYRTWDSIGCGVEEVGFQEIFKWNAEEKSAREQVYLPWVELKPKGRMKDNRIERLQPLCARKKFFFLSEHQDIVAEFLRWPYGKTKDRIDTLAYQLDMAFSPSGPEIETEEIDLMDMKLEQGAFEEMMSKRREKLTGGSHGSFDWYND